MKMILFFIGSITVCMLCFWTHSFPGGVRNHTVKNLLANPREFFDKEVTVSGAVGNTVAVMGTGFFQLQDEDGNELTVLSRRGIPAPGQNISIRGTLCQALAVGSNQMLVFVEGTKRTTGSSTQGGKKP